jgi:hypothetical protein
MYGVPETPGQPHPPASLPALRRVEGRVFHPAGTMNARHGSHPGAPGARETNMATIGTFERVGDSEYLGDIFTLSLRAKNVRIVAVSRTGENAPSHRIYVDQVDYAE